MYVSNISVRNSYSCLENLTSEDTTEVVDRIVDKECIGFKVNDHENFTNMEVNNDLELEQTKSKNITKLISDEDTLELKALLKEYSDSIDRCFSTFTTLEQATGHVSKREPD